MKAWKVDTRAVGICLVWAPTRSAARFQCFYSAKDAGWGTYGFSDIGRVIRWPEYDNHPKAKRGCYDPTAFQPTNCERGEVEK